jgi:hypothetical protein
MVPISITVRGGVLRSSGAASAALVGDDEQRQSGERG